VILLSALVVSVWPQVSHAGDILRGGATAGSARKNTEARQNAGAEAASLAKAKAQDRLARTTKAINDMRQLQASARAAAGDGGVPDGLVPGGLERLAGGTWTGASAPVQAGNAVNITQTKQQALLDWKTFNVGKNTSVNFDQTAGGVDSGKWIAFNKVFDPSGKPSQIRGQIKAEGQVYIINQNGIIFGAGSQVNARTLVASSLPINDNLVEQGLLNNKDAQFLFSALDVPGGADGTKEFKPAPPLTADGRNGDIVVEAGATISGPVSAEGNGGRVMFVGTNVRNEGTISTPSGQTILAAGRQVGVQAHNSEDPSLRGLDVWVGVVGENEGRVTNAGIIEAATGSVTIVGRDIEQRGIIHSSTSVSLNGRIDLLASYGAVANPNFDNSGAVGSGFSPFLSQYTGSVTFADSSVTQILPDYADKSTVPGTKLPEVSQINIEGQIVSFGAQSYLIATSGNIGIRAGVWPYRDTDGSRTIFDAAGSVEAGLTSNFELGVQRFLFKTGQILVNKGATIDVSGTTNAAVDLSKYLMKVELRGSELADSPLQRTSSVRGKSMTVDIRKSGTYGGRQWLGTPLGDLTGIANVVQSDVSQLTAGGGSISMQAGDSVVIERGAIVDVSGGYFSNSGGKIKTTQLLRGGNLINIANATPDIKYDGIFQETSTRSSSKWGVSKTYTKPLAPTGGYTEAPYVEGAGGGTFSATAPVVDLSGDIVGQTVTGPRQLNSPPALSSLNIAFKGQDRIEAAAADIRFIETSPSPPSVSFVSQSPQTPSTSSRFLLGADIFREGSGGFGNVSIENSDGNFSIPKGVSVDVPAGGSLVVTASNALIEGEVHVPGGTFSIKAYNFSPYLYQELSAKDQLTGKAAPSPVAGRGKITVAAGAHIDVSGMLVDERPTSKIPSNIRRSTNGGTVVLEAYDISLAAGSRITASAGALASYAGKIAVGKAGSISLLAGRDPSLSTTIGGRLVVDGSLEAYSTGKGGSLTVQSSLVQIGETEGGPDTLTLKPDFFRKGGFTSYSVKGIGGRDSDGTNVPAISVLPGTQIDLVAESWILEPHSPGGGGMRFTTHVAEPGLRSPVSLSLSAAGADDLLTEGKLEALGLIVIGKGSVIRTDPGASVSMSGDAISLGGRIEAPGGSVTLTGRSEFRLPRTLSEASSFALPTVYVTETASIDVSGKTVLTPDPFGRRRGTVYDGGSIYISGNIFAEAGAVFDVSGTSAILDVDPQQLSGAISRPSARNGLTEKPWGRRGIPTRIDSNGGSIEMEGSQMLYSDATLRGFAGGPSATGGTLSVSSGRFYSFGASRTSADINLIVTQTGSSTAFANHPLASSFDRVFSGTVDLAKAFENPPATEGISHFSVSRFSEGGFASLDLGYKYYPGADPIPYGGNVEFRGPVSINASGKLRVAAGGIIKANAPVGLTARYIAIGQQFQQPLNPSDTFFAFQQYPVPAAGKVYYPKPTFGPASLTLNADLVDVGTLSLQNIGSAAIRAPNGDIRGSGTLSMVGDLTLEAGQIYPTTLADFTIIAYDPAGGRGSVSILPGVRRSTPLSAGGSLNIYASNISQRGTLSAPLGSIRLGWDGTDFDPSTVAFEQPSDINSGASMTVPTAQSVVLGSGSMTSVSALDALTGEPMLIPFGLSSDGLSWIDPRGVNVTVTGLPKKSVAVAGGQVTTEEGSTIDVRGGGDLLAYKWARGTGGSTDLLGSSKGDWNSSTNYAAGDLVTYQGKTWSARAAINPGDFDTAPTPQASRYWAQVVESYAIVPDYGLEYSPFASFNTGANAPALSKDPGYISNKISIGDQIYLDGSEGLPKGSYTLLPKRYALMPGAFLVTPTSDLSNVSAKSAGSISEEGASYTLGYRFNRYNSAAEAPSTRTLFEVATPDIIAGRVLYETFRTETFMPEAAQRFDATVLQRLPIDSGSVSFQGNSSLRLEGRILTSRPGGGRGANIDVSAYGDIAIVGGSGSATPGTPTVLSSEKISSWGAESVLIGGLRREASSGITVDVRADNVLVSNAGAQLTSPELILASRKTTTIAPGSSIQSSGSLSTPATSLSINGDGSLLWVSGNPDIALSRTGLTASTLPRLVLGAGAIIKGAGVIADSSYGSDFSPSTIFDVSSLTLNSGQVSILMQPQAGPLAGSVVSPHLVLEGALLQRIQQVDRLAIGSYRSIDIYGTGSFGSSSLRELRFRAGGDDPSTVPVERGIRAYSQGAGTASFAANSIVFENPTGVTGLAAPAAPLSGAFLADAGTITIGANNFGISGYSLTTLSARNGVATQSSGTFATAGAMDIITPMLAGGAGSSQGLTATGQLRILSNGGTSSVSGGLGAGLSIQGSAVSISSKIHLPSGLLSITSTSGNIDISGQLDVSGTAQSFYDLIRYTDGGNISLSANSGAVQLLAGSVVSVAASPAGANAGSLSIKSSGSFSSLGTLLGSGSSGGTFGTFVLDVGSLASFSGLTSALDQGGFTEERNLRIRSGDITVSGSTFARKFTLSTDSGSISVSGTINASGETGGEINLLAKENITLLPTSVLTVAARRFTNAGKGGTINLEAGSEVNGAVSATALLDIQAGSRMDLSVAAFVPGSYTTPGSSAFNGQFTGTLHLRAPQRTVAGNLGVAVSQLRGDIVGASSILVEGYKVFSVTGATGQITGSRSSFSSLPSSSLAAGTTERLIYDNAVQFMGAAGATTAGYTAMVNSLLGVGDPKGLSSLLVVAPGAEIINTTINGDVTLGNATSNWSFDWNLADFRFGPKSAPGVLTIRAPGNVVFWNTLSDGFTAVNPATSGNGNSSMWLAPLMAINTNLPTNTQSWAFRITSGTDLTAVDSSQRLPDSSLGSTKGSIRIGKTVNISGAQNTTAGVMGTTALSNFQVIRTGTGNIQLSAARDIKLLNPFASIYTAGARIANPNAIYSAGDFVTPVLTGPGGSPPQTSQLGPTQQVYDPQWSMAGGNISLLARGTIGRYAVSGSTDVVSSSKELPNNWLYRRDYVDGTGLFGIAGVDTGNNITSISDPSASTAWWIDFSNFFEGVGALGGGDVTLSAGLDIINVDAVIPTNARAPGLAGAARIAPSADALLELGGGNLKVSSGRDISGGVYYVERGTGRLSAGGSILTNSSRSPKTGGDTLTWLPTTLFVGKSSFDVSARKDVLLGPVVNTFWLPQGIQNKFWYKTYFSTYSPDSYVNVSSLGGSITHRLTTVDSVSVSATATTQSTQPILALWLSNQNLFRSVNPSASQPWIRLAEGDVSSLDVFSTVGTIMPPTLRSTAFGGDINIVGKINLFPSETGTLEMVAAGSINGLNPVSKNTAGTVTAFTSGSINISDADPSVLPSALSPYALQSDVGTSLSALRSTRSSLLASKVDIHFQETGSYAGTESGIDRKRARHQEGLLHLRDLRPAALYATKKDISGLTLYSAKQIRILAERDITDVAFYLQNNSAGDVSIVSAGRDIIPFNESSKLRSVAGNKANGNIILDLKPSTTAGKTTQALSGDIQINGPGTLEVLAGRNLDLGTGENFTDGRGNGITSIGKSRNPFLPFAGADIIAFAGVGGRSGGPALGLSNSVMDFSKLPDAEPVSSEAGAIKSLVTFFGSLKEAGVEFATTGTYDTGFEAVDLVFGDKDYTGEIFTRARDIRTTSGGKITLGAPGGGLTLASTITGNPKVPPGIVTEYGGEISIFANNSVDIGQARIFTLRGGDLTIWSTSGDIAAGTAPKTVVTAPPTRVLFDTTSADVLTDLGGLATGGGIGVLASVKNVAEGNVALIAPNGTVDAGDAGIRATGNIVIAAVRVLNADNISAGGATIGVPSAPVVAAPNVSGLTSGTSSTAAASTAAESVASQGAKQSQQTIDTPSTITVEVLGYGGGDDE